MINVDNTTDQVVIVNYARMNGKAAMMKEYVEARLNPKVFCKFCGRQLKSDKSKQNGYGQGCYARWVKSRANKRSLI